MLNEPPRGSPPGAALFPGSAGKRRQPRRRSVVRYLMRTTPGDTTVSQRKDRRKRVGPPKASKIEQEWLAPPKPVEPPKPAHRAGQGKRNHYPDSHKVYSGKPPAKRPQFTREHVNRIALQQRALREKRLHDRRQAELKAIRQHHPIVGRIAPELAKAKICAGRKVRKEVLHALGRTRSGKGSSRPHTPESKVRCS